MATVHTTKQALHRLAEESVQLLGPLQDHRRQRVVHGRRGFVVLLLPGRILLLLFFSFLAIITTSFIFGVVVLLPVSPQTPLLLVSPLGLLRPVLLLAAR